MKQVSDWQVPKWPFLLGNAALIGVAAVLITRPTHPITTTEILIATVSVALGALLGCLPFIMEYRATSKLIEVNALGAVAEKIENLERFATQISTATDQWARVQESTQSGAEKTVASAREITERMATEVREFNEFQAKINDSEKGTLRLEVDKLRRAEGEWLQVVARILDHIFALHNAASRSGQPELAEQVGLFQNACRDAARRVGLTLIVVAAGESLDGERHRVHGLENPPANGVIAETLAPGLSFQGRLIRPALVSLQELAAPAAAVATEIAPEQTDAPAAASGQLTLDAD
jgi:molecular chaperone GrpE (heat shock protein)